MDSHSKDESAILSGFTVWMKMMKKIFVSYRKATAFAKKKHEGQLYEGRDFFESHPLEVYRILKLVCPKDMNLQIAGLLHDTLEDTETTFEELVENFGIDIASLVREVTKAGKNYFPHLDTQRGVILKFADRLTNVSHMETWDEERKHKYLFEKSKFWIS